MAEDSGMWSNDEYHFYGQRSNEKVMMVRNQHPVILLPVVLAGGISLFIPFFLAKWFEGPYGFAIMLIYWVIFIVFMAYHLYGYRSSVSILSDQRILNVNQKGFFNRQITEAELTRIQDVSTNIQGVFQTMFNFGNVAIRTASKDTVLTLRNMGDPYDVQQSIVRALKGVSDDE
jgi:membrane protein YdbS with pleckstrin-like domain